VTPAYFVGIMGHLSESELYRIRLAGIDGKGRSIAMAVSREVVAGSREFDKFFYVL
jgi:hypothetical protein